MENKAKARIDIPSDIMQEARRLARGASEVLPSLEALALKLLEARNAKRPLNVKLGIDPTGFDVHIGHGVPLRALARFGQAGHNVQLLLGGSTAQIGDPTGRDTARAEQTAEEVRLKGASFVDQIRPIVNVLPQNTFNNADWDDRFWANARLLFKRLTLNPFLGKEAFAKRLDEGKPVSFLEAIYPMMQGFDSVELHADIEIGGRDQRFNLLMGRQIQPLFGQEPQVVMMFDLLEGTDGVQLLGEDGVPAADADGKPKFRKMSKSFNNTIALRDAPNDMFGKCMRLPDSLIVRFFDLATTVSADQVAGEATFIAGGGNPRDAKERLATQLVRELHGPAAAEEALAFWRTVHTKRSAPTDMPLLTVSPAASLLTILVDEKLADSKGKARQLIEQGGVRLDEVKVTNVNHVIDLAPGKESVLKVGKKGQFRRLVGKPAP